MIENKFIEIMSVQILTKPLNQHRRKYLIQTLRNLLFEYEAFEQKFMDMNVPRDICKLLIDEQGIVAADLAESWKQYAAPAKKNSFDNDNCNNLIDGLLLLANSDALLKRMKAMELELLLQHV